jgi:hypothetical protein
MLKERITDPLVDARIGLAGPVWGMGAAIAAWLVWFVTGGHRGRCEIGQLLQTRPVHERAARRARQRQRCQLGAAAVAQTASEGVCGIEERHRISRPQALRCDTGR